MPRRIRPCIQALHAYTPGEQPKIPGLIKLNTNENPYPPSPKVFSAIRRELDSKLRLYPDPNSNLFCEKIGEVYGFKRTQVIAGNGSDDILTMSLRAFVGERQCVQFPKPTYSLYPVLTQIQNGKIREVPFNCDFSLNLKNFDSSAVLTMVVHPNAPSGTPVSISFLRALSRKLKGVLLVDEAYADFASENALSLAQRLPNVLVTRSFSKSFSLAGVRLGFAVGAAPLIEALAKVKDSYNLDRLAQAAGVAALSDMSYHRKTVSRIVRTRERFRKELLKRDWKPLPSEANFIFVRPAKKTAASWFAKFRDCKILVRWFSSVETRDYLRITIGTDREMARVINVIDENS